MLLGINTFIFCLIYALVSVIAYLFYARKAYPFNPVFIFYLYNSTTIIGAVIIFDSEKAADVFFVILHTSTLAAFAIGAIVAGRLSIKRLKFISVARQRRVVFEGKAGTGGLVLFYVLSFLLVLYYFYIAGGHFFVRAGGVQDIAGLRFSYYAGENYLAPGYFKQLKDMMLPLISIYFFILFKDRPNALQPQLRRFLLFFLFIALLFSLTGTGQRAPLLNAALLFIVAMSIHYKLTVSDLIKRALSANGISFVMVTFLVFFSTTLILGRTSAVGDLVPSLVDRILFVNQRSALVGFNFFLDNPKMVEGQWVKDIMSVLPGRGPSGVDNIIFSLLWGSERGNAPLSLFSASYFAFGFACTLLIFFLFGIILHVVYEFALANKRVSMTIVAAGLILCFGLWRSGTVLTVLVKGLPAVFLLYCAIKLMDTSVRGRRMRRARATWGRATAQAVARSEVPPRP